MNIVMELTKTNKARLERADADMLVLSENAYNDLYLIAYGNENGQINVDYTTNLAELLTLMTFHAKHTDHYQIIKIKKGEK